MSGACPTCGCRWREVSGLPLFKPGPDGCECYLCRALPCGHPAACVSTGSEGTSYCRWCEDVGRLRHGWEEAADAATQARASLTDALRLVAEAHADRDEARQECERLRDHVSAYERELSLEMPMDFKDWWENARAEWPLVAMYVLRNRREEVERLREERDELNRRQHDELMGLWAERDAARAALRDLVSWWSRGGVAPDAVWRRAEEVLR